MHGWVPSALGDVASANRQVVNMLRPKYRVFISSTFRHLGEARKAAIAGVSDCQHIPIALDNFSPETTSDVDVIKREVESSQVYVLILGPTLGQTPRGSTKSFTELEFEFAKEMKKEIWIFKLAWEDVKEHRPRLLAAAGDSDEDGRLNRLREFYGTVGDGTHLYKEWRWDDPQEIRRQVIMGLSSLVLRDDPPRGLVDELGDKEDFVADTIEAIRSFKKLYRRIGKKVPEKTKAAQFFIERYLARIKSETTRGIFFESGSSVAFVAKELPDGLWKHLTLRHRGLPRKRILTNNVLVYLRLWLNKGVPCAHFPRGTPEKTYGASYGPIDEGGNRAPVFTHDRLDERARRALATLEEDEFALKRQGVSIIITAASGLQLGSKHKIDPKPEHDLPQHVWRGIEKCFGPHVGSYNNRIFKRHLYDTKIPLMLFLDSDKIDCAVDIRRCHFVFGAGNKWRKILSTQPIALCVGCKSEKMKGLIRRVKPSLPGFEIVTCDEVSPYSAFIARNAAFESQFPE